MSIVISVVNQKGGVGKSTTVVNLSTAIASIDKSVLVIDLDPQGNCTSGFGIQHVNRKITIYQALIGFCNLSSTIVKTYVPKLNISPSNTNLVAAEFELVNMDNREYILHELIKSVNRDYDYVILDCPPSTNLLTINALVASNEVLIPMLCDFYSLEGLSNLLKTIDHISKFLNSKISICGILFTMYDRRSKLCNQVEYDVRSCLGNLVFKTTIPRNIKLAEAPSHGKPAILYDYKCLGSMAYMQLTQEILQNHNNKYSV